MQNLGNDLSTIASVDKRVFDKLINNANFCICDYLENAVLNNEHLVDIDIGIGILKITIGDDIVKYNFVPSEKLELEIINTLENGQNSLLSIVDSSMISKLKKLYEGLL